MGPFVTSVISLEDLRVWIGVQMLKCLEPSSDDGSGSERQQERVDVRAAIREALEDVRKGMECEGRFLYGGRWRTREEIRTLRWKARSQDLGHLRDIVFALLFLAGSVALAYRAFFLFLFP